MNISKDVCYTLVDNSCYSKMTEGNLKYCLEYGNIEAKRNAMKEIIVSLANGDTNESYLILIIRFILPMQDHTIKKLLLIFWELYPKVTNDGELIKEMILVCDAFRKDLQHPNEYMRGATLRFLCKLKQPEILEPLMGAIRANLNHKRPYVRRNTVLAIYTIHKNYEYLIPDAAELIEDCLKREGDTSCKRNAFITLLNTDIDKAVDYLISSLDYVSSFDQSLQIVVIELIEKICQKKSHEKSGFIRCIYTLLDSKNHAVRYEAARALIMLTNAPTALKATISCYIDIIMKANDNTTKLIVLDRLVDMKYRVAQKRILQESVPNILGLLPRNNDIKVKIKIINLVTYLVTENNVNQIVSMLKKEFSKDDTSNDYINYEIYLTQKLHKCYLKFPQTAVEIVPFFNDLLSIETNEKVLINILIRLREAALKFEEIRAIIINRLKDSLSLMTSLEVYCKSLWILVEFTEKAQDMENIMHLVYWSVKEMANILNTIDNEVYKCINDNNVLEISKADDNIPGGKLIVKPLIEDIFEGTGYMGAAIGASVGKLALRYMQLFNNVEDVKSITSHALYSITIILHLNRLKNNSDSSSRLLNSLILILKPKEEIVRKYLVKSTKALSKMISSSYSLVKEELEGKRMQVMQPDEAICLLQTSDQSSYKEYIELNNFEETNMDAHEHIYKIDKILQLTGFSDPIYSETKMVHTSEQNIALHIVMINRTQDTLQNCSVRLASTGDLIITDDPQPKTLGPNGKAEIKINVKVALTGNSIIFGNILFDTVKTTEHSTIVLNDIPIDVIDYIKPSDCHQDEFRKMWLEFEWENKVYLAPKGIKDLITYLNLISKSLRMKCLTPKEAMMGESRFLTANLHGLSIFGESVIANLSLERSQEGNKITGHIRLRAKSQGMVLGLGDIVRYLQC